MQIEITAGGFWIDPEGNRWRLVPLKTTSQQNDAALAKAKRWNLNGKNARAEAWNYVQGYHELVEHAPAPPAQNAVVTGGGAHE